MFRNFKFSKYLLNNGWLPFICTIHAKYSEKIDYRVQKEVPDEIKIFRATKFDIVTSLSIWMKWSKKQFAKIVSPKKEKNQGRLDSDLGHVPAPRLSIIKRLSNFIKYLLWFPDRYSGWIFPGFIYAFFVVKRNKIDVLYSSSPPASTLIIGLLLKKCTKLPWVVDYRDPWTNDYKGTFNTRFLKKIHQIIEKAVLRNADAIIFNTEGMRDIYQENYGHKFDKKLSVIMNGVDVQDFENFQELVFAKKETAALNMIHTGEFFNPGRLPDSLLQAIGELVLAEEISKNGLQVSFVGGAEYKQWTNYNSLFAKYPLIDVIDFTEHVSHREVIQNLAGADLLLLLQTDSMFSNQIPAKVFEYILSGKPILAIITEGVTKNLLEQLIPDQRNLWIVPPVVPKIKECLLEIVHNKSQGDLLCQEREQGVVGQISRKNLTKKLASLLDDISSR